MRHYSDGAITLSAAAASLVIAEWRLLGAFDQKARRIYYHTRGLIAGDRMLRRMLEDSL